MSGLASILTTQYSLHSSELLAPCLQGFQLQLLLANSFVHLRHAWLFPKPGDECLVLLAGALFGHSSLFPAARTEPAGLDIVLYLAACRNSVNVRAIPFLPST